MHNATITATTTTLEHFNTLSNWEQIKILLMFFALIYIAHMIVSSFLGTAGIKDELQRIRRLLEDNPKI